MHWAQLFHQIYVARWTLFGGLVTTLEISALVIVIGTIAGLLVGLGLCFGHITVRLAMRFYVDLIRGVPSLVLIFFSFYGTSLLGLDISAFTAGVFALAVSEPADGFCGGGAGEGTDLPGPNGQPVGGPCGVQGSRRGRTSRPGHHQDGA